MDNNIIILGIESSCDDTSAAVLRGTTLLSSVIASQAVHEKYGGVIPELASRAHQQNIVPVVDTALKDAGLTIDKVDAIAFTRGPGLLGSLMVGTSFAKGLSIANNIPMVEVNHLQNGSFMNFMIPHRCSCTDMKTYLCHKEGLSQLRCSGKQICSCIQKIFNQWYLWWKCCI